jgi:hypothetical protein
MYFEIRRDLKLIRISTSSHPDLTLVKRRMLPSRLVTSRS